MSTLWPYEAQKADEFKLQRGDMIKVIGLWDDGWGTGVRVQQKAGDWTANADAERVQRSKSSTNPDGGIVKAFPLVCVCLPQHWRKAVASQEAEGEGDVV